MNLLNRYLRRFGLAGKNQLEPEVSFILIVYDMPEQARNTIMSLLPEYQSDVSPQHYEVIIVENSSANTMSADFVRSLPENFHYHIREESRPTPVHAVKYGAERARGKNICIMIDGARLVSPGVVKYILLGHRITERTVVTVPGYHLGSEVQQEAVLSGYGVEEERRLIRSINWPSNGYRLFEIACFSASSAAGLFLSVNESNCISIPRDVWYELGGCDERFDIRGGGMVNLDLYRRACEHTGVTHVILPGEGTFHQFHGGITTGGQNMAARDAYIQASNEQYISLRGCDYESPRTRPIFLGEIPEQARRFVLYSAQIAMDSENGECVEQVL